MQSASLTPSLGLQFGPLEQAVSSRRMVCLSHAQFHSSLLAEATSHAGV